MLLCSKMFSVDISCLQNIFVRLYSRVTITRTAEGKRKLFELWSRSSYRDQKMLKICSEVAEEIVRVMEAFEL